MQICERFELRNAAIMQFYMYISICIQKFYENIGFAHHLFNTINFKYKFKISE